MPLLARLVNRTEPWALAEDAARWKSGDFPYQVLCEITDDGKGGGVSFFEVQWRRDPVLRRLAAAKIAERGKLTSTSFRFVDLATVERLGITVDFTKGRTPDEGINHLHRELKGITGRQAIKLARAMVRGNPVIFKQERVARDIVDAFRKGRMLIDTYLVKALLWSLHKDAKAVELRRPRP